MFPLLFKVIVYENVSPTFTSVFDGVFDDVIFTVFTVSSGFSSPTVAIFLIAPLTFSTVALNLISTLLFAGTSVSISSPAFNLSAISFDTDVSSNSNIPSTINLAKVSSLTFAFPAISPVFVIVIAYVTLSPTFAVFSFFPSIVATLLAFIIAVCVLLVVFPFTIATFSIVPSSASTLTLKLTTFSLFSSSIPKSTFHLRTVSFLEFFNISPSLSIDPSTYFVFSGIASFISTSFNSLSELFVTVIL